MLARWERAAVGSRLGTTGLGLATLIVGRLGLLHPWAIRAGLAAPIVAVLGLPAWASLDPSRGRRIPDEANRPIALAHVSGSGWSPGRSWSDMALGAMLPAVEFDALEYHLQGPKEFFQAADRVPAA